MYSAFSCVKTSGTSFELQLENSVRPHSFPQPVFVQYLAQCMGSGYDMNNNNNNNKEKKNE